MKYIRLLQEKWIYEVFNYVLPCIIIPFMAFVVHHVTQSLNLISMLIAWLALILAGDSSSILIMLHIQSSVECNIWSNCNNDSIMFRAILSGYRFDNTKFMI